MGGEDAVDKKLLALGRIQILADLILAQPLRGEELCE
jgi:hypothetical protein